MRRFGLVLLAAVLLCGMAGVADAGSRIFDDTVSTCTGINCSSLRIPGSVVSFGPTAGQFEIMLFSAGGQCLRAEVISEGADLELVVRAPNGTVWRNDDRGGSVCPLCPRVVINGTPNNGWYSATLAGFSGAPVSSNFVLLY